MTGILIGLSGPSGIGKGYIKSVLRDQYPVVELTVMTTRPPRDTDGEDRKTGVLVADFLEDATTGKIIFAHQPFGEDWYGFLAEELNGYLNNDHIILTEVHPDNAEAFKREFAQNAIMIGMDADLDYLEQNMRNRATEPEDYIQLRLSYAQTEKAKVNALHQRGIIDEVVRVTHENKMTIAQEVQALVKKHLLYRDHHAQTKESI